MSLWDLVVKLVEDRCSGEGAGCSAESEAWYGGGLEYTPAAPAAESGLGDRFDSGLLGIGGNGDNVEDRKPGLKVPVGVRI